MDFAVFILGRPCNFASLNSAITEGPTPQVPVTELVRGRIPVTSAQAALSRCTQKALLTGRQALCPRAPRASCGPRQSHVTGGPTRGPAMGKDLPLEPLSLPASTWDRRSIPLQSLLEVSCGRRTSPLFPSWPWPCSSGQPRLPRPGAPLRESPSVLCTDSGLSSGAY